MISRDIQSRVIGDLKRETDFTFVTKDQSFSEQLNPNNPQYTQPPKAKQLTPQQKANRRAFVEELLSTYLMAETDAMYQARVEHEDRNMRFAANAVNNSQEIPMQKRDFPKLMRLLLASKNLSLDGQTDYLEQIISQYSINKALLEIKGSDFFNKVKSFAEKNKSEGSLINGKPKWCKETKGELGLRLANRAILKNPQFIEEAKRIINSSSKNTVSEQSDAIALSAVARTFGKIPFFTQNADGTFEFSPDEEVPR